MRFLELLKEGKIKEAHKLLVSKENVEKHAAEYDNDRKVRDSQVGNREDKITKDKVVPVAKITIPLQRKIVKSAASFLFGSPVEIIPDENNESTEQLLNLWDQLRMDSLLLQFCKTVKSETEATIVFFPVEKEGRDTKLKARILSNKNGKVYPVFDNFGDMVAFAWEYRTKEEKDEITYLYIWTAEFNYIFKGKGSDFTPAEEDPKTENEFGKIPVVYLSQDNPEWWEVQDLIDRFENSFSKFADTNDYFAHPTYKAKGGMDAKMSKDDSGRVVKMEVIETDKGNVIEADLDVLSWDRAPEALKLEFETTKELIFDLSNTADFAKMVNEGIGQLSGIAMRLMFFNSILKAKWDEGDYSVVISRALNILTAGMMNILKIGGKDLEERHFDVRFTSVLPENLKESIEILSEATGGKPIMSQKTAIGHNSLVTDNQGEFEAIKEEENAELIDELGESVL